MGESKAVRYIRAVERMHSISAAADELGISQPSLSLFLKNAEEKLGAAIFDRRSSPLALTEAGKALLDYEEGVELLKRDLMRKVSDIEDLHVGELVVGATASLSMTLLPRAVAAFSEGHPGVSVNVICDTLPVLAQAAVEGRVDAFVATSLQDNDAFDCVELGRERYFLCIPRDWPECGILPPPGEGGFAVIGEDELRLLDGRAFVSMNDDQQIGNKLEDLLALYGVRPSRVIRTNQALTCLALTGEGVGASLVTSAALQCCKLERPPLLYLPNGESFSRMLYIAKPRNRSTSRAVEAFIDMLIELAPLEPFLE